MIERPKSGRAIIKQDFNRLSIEIPAKQNWFVIIFLCIWLCGWYMGEVNAISMLSATDTTLLANAFTVFWLTGWTVGGLWVFTTLLWTLSGKEIISVQGPVLTIQQVVFGIGRKKQYDIQSIKNIKVISQPDEGAWDNSKSASFMNSTGIIQFDYGMKNISFSRSIDEVEGRMIVEKLKANSNFNKDNFA